MSNVIKSVYFQMDQEDARVINSDEHVAEFAPILLQRQSSPAEEEAELVAQEMPEGFQSGINVLNMEDVRREERRKMKEETSKERETLLEDARREADELLQSARAEADQLREQAVEEGRKAGFEQGQAEAQERLQEAAASFQQQMEKERQELKEQEEALEPKYAEIMAALIQKITGVVCQDKKNVIVYLIHQALNQLEKTKTINLRVSKQDILRVSSYKEQLKKCVSEGVEFDITEDDSLQGNQCIIETDQRIIDCSLDVQLQNLQDQIRMLTIM